MKKLYKYIGALLSVALMCCISACVKEQGGESTNLGLGIKVFSPTKVVTGSSVSINGTGFSDATAVVFPGEVVVTDFQIVSDGMIRVKVPAGVSSEGGNLIVRTAADEAESRLPLTLGHPVISGYSKQPGESIQGGELLSIFGTDLEFITSVEMLDADGNPAVIPDSRFYRKGTNTVIIIVPKKVFKGTFAGTVSTIDGKTFDMPELSYSPAAEGGHWEKVIKPFWTNNGGPDVSWSSDYRFALEGHDANSECIAELPESIWNRIKTETLYVIVKAKDPQVRVTTGWWDPNFQDNDFVPGSEELTSNEDGTWTLAVNIADNPDFLAVIDERHILITGDRFSLVSLCLMEDEWVEGGEGHWEIVKVSIWKNEDPEGNGAASWNGTYRFAPETNPTGEEIATIPTDVWEKMKTQKFYMQAQGSSWVQMRIVTGWWNYQWPAGKEEDITPDFQGDRIIDNGDGTYYIELDLNGTDLAANMDTEHLLFTGSGYTPLELYFEEEVWVGEDPEPTEVIIWKNDNPEGYGAVSWNGTYRFAPETNSTGEEIATIPTDVWEKMKTQVFYMQAQGSDWVQMRIVTGWWNYQWPAGKEEDITPDFQGDRIIDNGDGTYYIELDLNGTDLAANMDTEHLLFTGSGYTPLKLYFIE